MKIKDTIEFFYTRFFYSPKYALVPRFETENLVREAIKTVNDLNIETMIDVWTWTSVIPISIEKNTTSLKYIYWLDLSRNALKIAEMNKALNNSKIKLLHSDLLKAIFDWEAEIDWLKSEVILITANLPYIKNEDWENMSEDTKEEPKMALFWWKHTWFELYDKFFKQVLDLKSKFNLKKIILICEHGYNQSEIANSFFSKRKIFSRHFSDERWIARFIYIEI